MKIKFTVTADFEAEVTEDVAYEVMKDYGGNFNAWMEDNYQDYIYEDEFEIEDINYDKKEATELLSIIRKHIDEKGDTFLKSNLRSRLRYSKFPTAHIPALENMQRLEVDLELMEKIFEFADFNNPKEELNFIYLNGEYAEATNSRIVIRHKHKFNFENKIHFPPFFIEPMKDDAEVYVFENNQLFMKYKDEWFYGIDDTYAPRFPDVSRVLSKDDFMETLRELCDSYGALLIFDEVMNGNTKSMIVVLEDEKIGMRKLIARYPKLAKKFTSMINIPVFTNDELVNFAKVYTMENGFRIDQMGMLALYNLIGINQKEDQPMCIGTVKTMLDKAMERAQSGLFKHSKKRVDRDGYTVLFEKDFS